MLEHLGCHVAAERLFTALRGVIADGPRIVPPRAVLPRPGTSGRPAPFRFPA